MSFLVDYYKPRTYQFIYLVYGLSLGFAGWWYTSALFCCFVKCNPIQNIHGEVLILFFCIYSIFEIEISDTNKMHDMWLWIINKDSHLLTQEFVPHNVLPDDFLRAVKNSDYSSVSLLVKWLIIIHWNKICYTHKWAHFVTYFFSKFYCIVKKNLSVLWMSLFWSCFSLKLYFSFRKLFLHVFLFFLIFLSFQVCVWNSTEIQVVIISWTGNYQNQFGCWQIATVSLLQVE